MVRAYEAICACVVKLYAMRACGEAICACGVKLYVRACEAIWRAYAICVRVLYGVRMCCMACV